MDRFKKFLTDWPFHADKWLMFQTLWPQIPPGNIVECGVDRGKSLLLLRLLMDEEGAERSLLGFDSWRGYPAYDEEDAECDNPAVLDPLRNWHIGGGFDEWCSIKTVIRNMRRYRVDRQAFRLREGYFHFTLPRMLRWYGERIALIHIDCDLYRGYKQVLQYLWPLLVENGIVVFDEYHSPEWPGAKTAVDEFFKDSPYEIRRDIRYYVVKEPQHVQVEASS